MTISDGIPFPVVRHLRERTRQFVANGIGQPFGRSDGLDAPWPNGDRPDATTRCGVEPLVTGKSDVVPEFPAIWRRLGIRKDERGDNEPCVFGAPAHLRGMG